MKRFVVGTGRCGSTLLSRMLAVSPEMCSLFEFLNGLPADRILSSQPLSGAEFFELVATPHPFVTMVTSRGYRVDEVFYPFDRPGARYAPDDSLPWILVATLPRIAQDPDALFDRLRERWTREPERPAREHCVRLFDWLTERAGKRVWNERSGSSIDALPRLHAAYPDARFVHIHRSGEEASLSMREHAAFRLAVCLVYDLDPEVDLATALEHAVPVPGRDDPVKRMLERQVAVEHFGHFWSRQLAVGMRGLAALEPDAYLEVRFEDLIERPVETLRRIAGFFELDPERDGWTERAAAMVRGMPPSRLDRLPAEEQGRLRAACEVGNLLLGRES